MVSLWNAALEKKQVNVKCKTWKFHLCDQFQLIWGPYFLDGRRKNTTWKNLKEFWTRVAILIVTVPLRLVLLLFVSFFFILNKSLRFLVKKLQGNQNRSHITIYEVCFYETYAGSFFSCDDEHTVKLRKVWPLRLLRRCFVEIQMCLKFYSFLELT